MAKLKKHPVTFGIDQPKWETAPKPTLDFYSDETDLKGRLTMFSKRQGTSILTNTKLQKWFVENKEDIRNVVKGDNTWLKGYFNDKGIKSKNDKAPYNDFIKGLKEMKKEKVLIF
ncbi:hypothetical protein HNQ88_005203 [Aureibacter tunicatorum]|uniref:Uncharacterized protein n=4 Tax=Aureibacter tunicatorum TaxID=866807 RepID=A0AAE3XQD2_9BACT|nr:hypothetical protein [Aureibacter tunicatorum]